MKRIMSGVKPTGKPHIGNYFGAMRQFVVDPAEFESFIMVADYHGLNFIQNGSEMRTLTHDLILDYLGIGIDPNTATLFKQSDVPEHTELCWIFDTITTMPYLMRAHAFKDAEAKNKEISVGTFNYPLLMAADILLYSPDIVPVGQDQQQHVEYARDCAEKFNRIFGDVFTLPQHKIIDTVAVVPGTDGRKMSKSYGNTIPLFATRDEISRGVMSIVTDSSGDVPTNVYAMHKLLKTDAELAPLYEAHKGKYKALKEALIEDLDTMIAPLRERRESFASDPQKVKEIIISGGERARAIAHSKIVEVRDKIGVSL